MRSIIMKNRFQSLKTNSLRLIENRSQSSAYIVPKRTDSFIYKDKYENVSKLIKQLENEISQIKLKIEIKLNKSEDQCKSLQSNNLKILENIIIKIKEINAENQILLTYYNELKGKIIQSNEKEKHFQNICNQLQQEINYWRSKLIDLDKKNKYLKQICIDLQAKSKHLQNLESISQKSRNQLEYQKELIKQLQKENSQFEGKYKKLQNENNQYLAQIERLKSGFRESERTNKRLQLNIDQYKTKLERSQERNLKLESANCLKSQMERNRCANCAELINQLQNEKGKTYRIAKDCEYQLDNLNRSVKNLKSQLNQMGNKCKDLQDENDHIKSQLESRKNCDSPTKNANVEQIIFKMKNLNLNEEMDERNQILLHNYDERYLRENKKLESTIKEIEKKNKILQNKYEEYKLKFNQSNHEKQNLTSEYQKLLSERDNLKFLVKEIDDKNKILQNNYNKSEEENENLKFQRDKYLAEINKLESVLKESYTTNRRLHKDCDDCKAELQRSEERNSQLENEIEVNNRKNKEIAKCFQMQIKDSNYSNERLKLELKQSENKFQSLQNDNNNIKSGFAEQIEQLQSALKESDRKMGSLQRDFEDCKEKLKHSQERNLQLENEFVVNKRTIEEITEDFQLKMEDSNSSNEKMLLELNGSEDEYKRLQDENNNIKSGFASQIEQLELKMNEINEENKILQNNYSQSKLNQSEIDKINLQKENEKLKSSNNHAECKLEFNQSETEKSILIAEKSPKSQLFIDSTKGANTNEIGALEYKKNIPVIPVPPIGFNNPKGYCYLNCVIQVLASCDDFKKDIEKSDCSECFDGTDDSIFVKGLFDLIHALRNSDFNSVKESLNIIQQYITESSFGDDVYKCFMNILSRVSKVIKTNIQRPNAYSSLPVTVMEKAQKNFEKFKNKNPGLVFDNFYGQLTFQMTCDICAEICNESFQVIKSLTLAVPKSKSPIMLEDCINLFFNFSLVNVDEPLKCGCPKGSKSVKSITKLTHGPKYLFIYLNRGSYTDNGAKIDTFVTCSKKSIEIKDSTNNAIKYRLISVIDHVGNTFYGHYYCRSNFEGSDWWLLNDAHVEKCSDDEVVTKNAIVFLFKKEIDSAVM